MDTISTTTRLIIRTILFLIILLVGIVLTLIFQRSTMPAEGLASRITSCFHRSITTIFGIRIKVTGTPNKTSTLFVSNHLSWLDIPVIGQTIHTHFLSMLEVKNWPVVGWLATRAGTLYISRGCKIASSNAIDDISRVLRQDHNVVIFAEGRVTDGRVKKFHSRLLQSAVDTGSMLQPVALRYPSSEGLLVNPVVSFNGHISLGQSLFKVMTAKRIDVEIAFLEPLSASGLSRTDLASIAEERIRKHLGQPLNRPDS